MKRTLISFAIAGLISISPAYAGDYATLESNYKKDAFADADRDWARRTANKYDGCGFFGKRKYRRVEVLVSRYRAIGKAMNSGDEEGAVAAAEKFVETVNANKRFGACWGEISRKAGLPSSFARDIS